jgi:long-chain acyl-CoA synthetase
MTAVHDPLAVPAAAAPTTAVIEDDRRLSRAEFNALVNRYANLLIDLGASTGSKVA